MKEETRGYGVGSALLNRMFDIGVCRGKSVLCFALHDVVGWYVRHGFQQSTEFPELPWHIGRFLVWTPVAKEC